MQENKQAKSHKYAPIKRNPALLNKKNPALQFARGRLFDLRANASSISEERLSISSFYRGANFA